MCLARSTPHTGSSGAQGLWSEFTAKPQLAAPKGSTGPTSVVTLHKLFVPAARNQRRHLGPQKSISLPAFFYCGPACSSSRGVEGVALSDCT